MYKHAIHVAGVCVAADAQAGARLGPSETLLLKESRCSLGSAVVNDCDSNATLYNLLNSSTYTHMHMHCYSLFETRFQSMRESSFKNAEQTCPVTSIRCRWSDALKPNPPAAKLESSPSCCFT
jgi:hypothetical protein